MAKKKVPKRDLNPRTEMLADPAPPGTGREIQDSTNDESMTTHSTVLHRWSKSRTGNDCSDVSPTLNEARKVFAYTYHRVKPS